MAPLDYNLSIATQAVDELPRKTSTAKEARSDEAKAAAPSKPSQRERLWPERFIEKYFMLMPSWVRVLVYLLVVLTYVHNAVQDAPLVGQLWIRQVDGSEIQGTNYTVQTPTPTQFRTNAEGRWMLPTPKRLPFGSVQAELVSGEGRLLGRGSFCLPIPILGPLLGGQQYRMTFNPTTRQLEVDPTLACATLGSRAEASERAVSASNASESVSIDIKQITLRDTGHRTSPAEIYFRTYLNGNELKPFGLPARERKNSWLLLLDNRPAAPNGLQVTIPGSGQLRLELWDRDRSFKSNFRDQDDRLATFELALRQGERGTRVLKDGGTEVVLDVR